MSSSTLISYLGIQHTNYKLHDQFAKLSPVYQTAYINCVTEYKTKFLYVQNTMVEHV